MIRALVVWALLAGPAAALTCGVETFDGVDYSVCSVDLPEDRLALFLNGSDGAPLGGFSGIEQGLAEGETLAFAMNAGMFHPDRAPVGLFVQDGVEVARLQPNAGPGNFGLLPNGVFCIGDGWARVIETRAYLDEAPACRDATQSGPMLVIDGALHPRFLPGSTSRLVRNGVGTSADGRRAIFAISDAPVNFHAFARFFRDHLGLDQALYLDGKVSRLHAPALGRSDIGLPLGPMVGVVE